jgi:hypothetical protein
VAERNANEPVMGSGSMESSGRVCVYVFGSRHEDVFMFNLLYKDFYKFCTSRAICKDNAISNTKEVHSRQH